MRLVEIGWTGAIVLLIGGCTGVKDTTTTPDDTPEGDADADADADSDADADADSDADTDTSPTVVDCYGTTTTSTTSRTKAPSMVTSGTSTSTFTTGTDTTTPTTTTGTGTTSTGTGTTSTGTGTTTSTTGTGTTSTGTTSTGTTWTWTGTGTGTYTTSTGTTWTTTPPETGGIDTGGGLAGARIWFDARWGIDENGCLASTFVDGIEIPPQLNFRIGDPEWPLDLDLTDQYCTVQFLLAGGTPNPPWVGSYAALYWGLNHDGVSVVSDCQGVYPELFTYDAAAYLLGLGSWGVAAGPLNPIVQEAIVVAGLDPGDYGGGAVLNPWVDSNVPQSTVYIQAYETDIDENVILDGAGAPTVIRGADHDLGNGQIAQGYYDLYSYYYYQL
jgi:hypothetical protein